MSQEQLQEERKLVQMMSRNIREEILDATSLLFAQEKTLADQEASLQEAQLTEEEADKPQERDITVNQLADDNSQMGHKKILMDMQNGTRKPTRRRRS